MKHRDVDDRPLGNPNEKPPMFRCPIICVQLGPRAVIVRPFDVEVVVIFPPAYPKQISRLGLQYRCRVRA